ncbi:MAG: dihydropteroate synthase [Flavobacteriaceae bacterium]|nr:dihydropteroate synthase [Flavobacteriaceae bacterium]|tara:strand:+ start:9065 stop:9898 length:834 start_codon:yes stop_codon:yes gene_type:complete
MTINCKGRLVDLTSPKVMGVLNITPDSFFDGGLYKDERSILGQVEKMLAEGATFIDVGAYSSRPGADHVSEQEELSRMAPVIELILKKFPDTLISVDTFRSAVARKSIELGAALINDISGGNLDADMFSTIAELNVPYIAMHMQGTPQTMQNNPKYEDIVHDLIYFFSKKIDELHRLNVSDIIIDVGFGFGKTIAQNYDLLDKLSLFQNLDKPILAGVSRKSMLYKPLEISPQEALNATTAANTVALLNGANILRVHDVKEAVEAVKIVSLLKNQSN